MEGQEKYYPQEEKLEKEWEKIPHYLTKSNPFYKDYIRCQSKNVAYSSLAFFLAGATVILFQELCNIGKFVKRGPKLLILPTIIGAWTSKALMTTNSNLCHEDMEILYEKNGLRPLTGVDWRAPSTKYPHTEVGPDGKPLN